MTTEKTLSASEKETLRKLYGNFMAVKYSDLYENKEEYKEHKAEVRNALFDKMYEFGLVQDDYYRIQNLIYSENQLQFIEDAKDAKWNGKGELVYDYSGRGMYGDNCPAFICESHNDLTTHAKFETDSMGLEIVIYARH